MSQQLPETGNNTDSEITNSRLAKNLGTAEKILSALSSQLPILLGLKGH